MLEFNVPCSVDILGVLFLSDGKGKGVDWGGKSKKELEGEEGRGSWGKGGEGEIEVKAHWRLG